MNTEDVHEGTMATFSSMAKFYKSCFFAFQTDLTIKQASETTLSVLGVAWKDFIEFGLKGNEGKALTFLATLTLRYGHTVGMQLWFHDGFLHVDSGTSLRNYLKLQATAFENLLSTMAAINGVRSTVTTLEYVVKLDNHFNSTESCNKHAPRAIMPSEMFTRLYPSNEELWNKAIHAAIPNSPPLSASRAIFSRNFDALQKFTEELFRAEPMSRSLWLFFYALLGPLEVQNWRLQNSNNAKDTTATFCYRATRQSVFGFALEAFLAARYLSDKDGRAIQEVVDLTRSQVMLSARGYLEGGQLHDALDSIENIELVVFNASRDQTGLEALYRDVKLMKNFFANRALSGPATKLGLTRYDRCCVETDVGGVLYGDTSLCILPHGLTEPLFYSGAEHLVNFPVIAFLVARPFIAQLLRVLESSPQGSFAASRYAATKRCLTNQYKQLSVVSGSVEGNRTLLELSASLQVAYEAYARAFGFRTPLERQFFFRRFCATFCKMESTFLHGRLLPSQDMCNMVIRNVLDFYTTFQCFPEDYMGEVEVCKIL